MTTHDPAGPTAHLMQGQRRDESDPFASRCTLRISVGDPATSLDVPVRMEHGSRTGHAAEHGMLAVLIGAAIERVLENHYAEVVGGIEVEVVP